MNEYLFSIVVGFPGTEPQEKRIYASSLHTALHILGYDLDKWKSNITITLIYSKQHQHQMGEWSYNLAYDKKSGWMHRQCELCNEGRQHRKMTDDEIKQFQGGDA